MQYSGSESAHDNLRAFVGIVVFAVLMATAALVVLGSRRVNTYLKH